MSTVEYLKDRSGSKCELCSSPEGLNIYVLAPKEESLETTVHICGKCLEGIDNPSSADSNYWRCLNDSMWSEHIPVQVLVWRILDSLINETWAQDLKNQMYFDDDIMDWASALKQGESQTKDSNGSLLYSGDSVTLIKDLVVKGANFTAKRGTLVKNITLTNDPKHIEGKVNGTHIVLVAAFLKKV